MRPASAQTWTARRARRTRFLDQTLLRLARAGCTQVVLLACGMDTRAFRLDWPADTRLFEVDFEGVLTFRDKALASHGVAPRCERVEVAADLRQDRPTALHNAGFDPALIRPDHIAGAIADLTRPDHAQFTAALGRHHSLKHQALPGGGE